LQNDENSKRYLAGIEEGTSMMPICFMSAHLLSNMLMQSD
jgi:hypothetical protein